MPIGGEIRRDQTRSAARSEARSAGASSHGLVLLNAVIIERHDANVAQDHQRREDVERLAGDEIKDWAEANGIRRTWNSRQLLLLRPCRHGGLPLLLFGSEQCRAVQLALDLDEVVDDGPDEEIDGREGADQQPPDEGHNQHALGD